MLYAMVIGFFIKLVACAMQQKLIGENLAKYPAIRRAVNINAPVSSRLGKPTQTPSGWQTHRISRRVGGGGGASELARSRGSA